jgi:zinc protease
MNAEIDKLKKDGPTQKDLDKVKQQWLEAYKTSLQENGTWLNRILGNRFPGSDADRFINYEKYVTNLTTEQVKSAANIIFSRKNVVTAILRPEAKKEATGSSN